MSISNDHLPHPANRRVRSSPLKAAARIVYLLGCKAWLTLTFYPRLWRTRGEEEVWRLGEEFTQRWCRMCCRGLGLRVKVRGTPPAGGTLLAPNHQSYADVLVVGAAVRCFFISKSEVGRWPVIGFMLRRSMNLLIERGRKRDLAHAWEQIAARLRAGHSVCVFLEGTTTGGDRILLFRPGLVEAALEAGAPVMPVLIRYRPTHPVVSVAEDVAYWKDHVFGPHAWRLAGLPPIEVDVTFGEALRPEGHDRKSLAEEARRRLVEMFEREKEES